jgi:hypothetical protein
MGLQDIRDKVNAWDKIKVALIIIAALAIGSSVYNWYKPVNPVTTKEYIKVPEEKLVTKIVRVPVPGPKEIITIEKKVIVEKLKLPEWFATNKNEQAIANADLKPSKGGYSVVGTLNTETGVGNIIAKEKERPFFGFPNEKEIGIRAGVSNNGTTGDIYGRWQFVRAGKTYLGAYVEGSASTGTTSNNAVGKAMIDISYKFE